jgi:hexosaminidase
MHLGGDEVVQDCWSDDPEVVAWMKANGISSTWGVYNYFMNHQLQIASSLNRSVIFWQDVFDNSLPVPTSTIIEVWESKDVLAKVLTAGYNAL